GPPGRGPASTTLRRRPTLSPTRPPGRETTMPSLRDFIEHNFRHFNARETLEAAQAYDKHIDEGGKMVVAMGGAMSTGEIGLTLARMIREDKVHAVSCTAANLEEDIFNLIGRPDYEIVPGYRDLTPEQET